MEAVILLFAILIYIGFVFVISECIKSKNGTRRKPFWWVFFFGLFGAIITILLDIRDNSDRL